jgi:hypothetical protein
VIARKLSFGSHSLAGANTLDTLALQPHRAPDMGTILFDEPAITTG